MRRKEEESGLSWGSKERGKILRKGEEANGKVRRGEIGKTIKETLGK